MSHKDAMNILNVSLQHSILTLAAHGWSHRRIARELDLNRETVGKYLRLARSKPAISTPGSESAPAAKPAISTLGSTPGRQSLCQPWQPQIKAAVSVGLSAQRIYQDLVGEHGFTGSYQAVKRFVRHLRETQPIPFVRMEVEPGQEAQVDFGQGAWVMVEGKRKRPHLFRIVLSHSRKGYSEVVWRQTTESFIRCLENAFRHFGGVPRTLVIDNLRAAVTRADWFDPELNAKVAEFCRHYGTVMLPTRPAMPHHKGKIEAGVKFAQNNALKGHSFESLSAQNLFLLDWESGVADTRIHGTTRQQVGKVFNEMERPKLLPLPEGLFPVFEEALRTVHRVATVVLLGSAGVRRAHRLGALGVPADPRVQPAPGSHRHSCAGRAGEVRDRPEPSAFPAPARHPAQSGLSAGSRHRQVHPRSQGCFEGRSLQPTGQNAAQILEA
jgi:transposase